MRAGQLPRLLWYTWSGHHVRPAMYANANGSGLGAATIQQQEEQKNELGPLEGSAALLVVNFRKEIVFPGCRLRLERADFGHEISIFHGVFRRHGPAHLRSGNDLADHLKRQF